MRQTQEVARQLLPAALALSDRVSHEELHRGTVELLSSLIPCDDVLWTWIDVKRSRALVSRGSMARPDEDLALALANRGLEHPAIASYLAANDDRQPRRVSDVIAEHEWISSAIYTDAFQQDRARFQLSVVVDLGQGVGKGWVLTRSSSDFSDDDLEVASLAQPCLVLLDRLATIRNDTSRGERLLKSQPSELHLTHRESQVLRLLATGLKASALGRVFGISEATARKHIEHIYTKLGSHDRLSAVLQAQQLGLLD